jgi:hypothetical protein
MIEAYLEQFAATLSFDRALARRVVQEVEDHLRETIAADPARDRAQAERDAIAGFGEPRAFTVQFAAIALARRARRVGVAVVLAVLAVLAAMKARVAWYAAMQWSLSEEVRPLAARVLAVDRYAFWLAAVIGVGTLLYIGSRRARSVPDAAYRKQHRYAAYLCAAAMALLLVVVISDGVLTMLLLAGIELNARCAVPVIALTAEIVCVGAVIVMIGATIRRAGHIEALLKLEG